ncbi:ERF family protein [Sphingopyxis sp. SCN 67-31]|uniref:ERF family protein n=1 Tax=Sphingopyxis sp. SCN 67-31 TaxID=1660142 RepID=UPI00086E1FBF|nr:ERF family protein [Sphingopyxis sp. SCN 67-31]ODU28764.1 MAG: hypothetical protein ABS88_11290 [Sphingopyxis sp. SCN 67-31]
MTAVYKAIAAIQEELSKVGIAKDGVNEQQKYRFRGIDQVYSALSPLLAKHGLCVLPRMVDCSRSERVSMKPGYNGGPPKESVLFYVTVTAEFDFVAVEDGSTHTVRTYGEAMDSGDKATNKAMSAAYKYAAFMAFAIPTEGDNDADATTHEVVRGMPDDELNRLTAKMKAGRLTPARVCEKYGVKDIRALNYDQFNEVIGVCDERIAKQAKAETNKAAQSNDDFGDISETDLAA